MSRKFDDLRPSLPPKRESDPDSIEQVVGRLLASRDGGLFQAWLKAEAQAPSHPNASAETLREAEGARRLIDRILSLPAA